MMIIYNSSSVECPSSSIDNYFNGRSCYFGYWTTSLLCADYTGIAEAPINEKARKLRSRLASSGAGHRNS